MNTVIERIIRDIYLMNIEEIKKDKKKYCNPKIDDLNKKKEKDKSQEQFLKYEWSWTL